jgi:hypothetical protein
MLLADRGHRRAPSVPDLIVAATTELAGPTVLHVDKDFELIAAVTIGRLQPGRDPRVSPTYRRRVRKVSRRYRSSQSVVKIPNLYNFVTFLERPRQDSNLRTRFGSQSEFVQSAHLDLVLAVQDRWAIPAVTPSPASFTQLVP